MVNLMNTCVFVKTRREYEYILNEAEKQGFHWYKKDDCEPFEQYTFPDILKFSSDNIVYRRSGISLGYTFYEASELLGTKEIAAREFIKRIVDMRHCKTVTVQNVYWTQVILSARCVCAIYVTGRKII